MRKILAVAAIFACVFAFAGCKDDEEQVFEQPETTRYRLEVDLDDMGEAVVVEDILVFGRKNGIAEPQYYSSESNLELGSLDFYVYSPWRNTQEITYIEVLYKIRNKYFGVDYNLRKDTDNTISLYRNNEISEEVYLIAKSDYEEHTRY